jgi:mono/diheme cytochrome c family protein
MTNRWVLGPLAAGLCLFAAADVSAADPVTYAETIAPILFENCVTCHRPGETAPFSLTTFEDAKKRGALIATVTKSRYMPPWHAAHGYGEFVGERRLTDEQIAVIGEWVKQGMPEGDRSKTPKLPVFPEGWKLGAPDVVLEMPVGYNIPASGPDQFRNFVIPTNLVEDRWVRAVDYRPSARTVVHHAIFSRIKGGAAANRDGADGKPGFPGAAPVGFQGLAESGGLGGWVPGATAAFLPEGMAMRLPKGSDFVLQIHFHPSGKPETERSQVALYFSDKAPERSLIDVDAPTLFSFGKPLDIAAGAKDYAVEDSVVLPVDVRAYAVGAHAHYLGKEMKATATLPDGTVKPLLWIQDWDFNWQDTYTYKDPFDLPRGTRIDVKIGWDNSTDNPRNPRNPPRRVYWGLQSQDEMGGVNLVVATKNKEDEGALTKFLGERGGGAGRAGFQNGNLARMQQVQRISQAPSNRITLVDRQGARLAALGEPALLAQPALSPDGKRVVAIHTNRESGFSDVWIYDIATGQPKALTNDEERDLVAVWSPDGSQIAWTRVDSDFNGIYRQAADGSGKPELLYKHNTGGTLFLTDWTKDMLCFWATDSQSIYVLPLHGDRQPITLFEGRGGRISPDGRYIAYSTNSGVGTPMLTYVRPLNLSAPATKAVQVHKDPALGGIMWRADGKAFTFTSLQVLQTSGVWQVEISESPDLTLSEPRLLFKPVGLSSPAQLSSIATPDLERFVTVPPVR